MSLLAGRILHASHPSLHSKRSGLAHRPVRTTWLRKANHLQASASDLDSPSPSSSPRCIVMECDGVLMDVHADGHRVAFNKAFEEMGYGCAQWAPSIYYDLMRMGDSTGPGLIRAYYDIMGWPIMLPTKERPAFVDKIYAIKKRVFKEMVDAAEVPLRQGAAEFLDDALADAARVVVLAGTNSAPEDSVVSAAMMRLGPTRAFKINVLYLGAPADVAGSLSKESGGEQGVEEESSGLSMETQLAQAQSQAKKVAAASFTRAVNLQTSWGTGMRMDPSLVAAKERAILASPSYLAAILEATGASAGDSVMVAASHSLMEAAKAVGMGVTAGMPPSLAARGGYAACDAKFDSFGPGGGLTWRKLKFILEKKA